MSNNPKNVEQDLPLELSEQQQNPGRAKPTDFTIIRRDDDAEVFHGQSGPVLVAESQQMRPNQPLPDRNYVPRQQ
jgi:hypothetical protein